MDGINETTKCECFGLNSFLGDKCELKSISMKIIETTNKTTTSVAIIIIVSLYCLTFLMDVHNYFIMKPTKNNKSKRRLSSNSNVKITTRYKNSIRNINQVPIKLYYKA